MLLTRMHSSRMRTGRSLTVCWHLLPRRGVCLLGGVPAGGVCSRGVSALGGCLVLGGSALGGCLLWGGVCSRGYALGVCVCSEGVSALGGVSAPGGLVLGGLLRGGIPACTEADTLPPLWTESQMHVKTLPWPNFVAAGNYPVLTIDVHVIVLTSIITRKLCFAGGLRGSVDDNTTSRCLE